MQEYRSKAIELDKMVDEPPVIRLSLYEKYDYFMQKADENPDQILDAIIKEYESSDYYYTKTQKALKYKSPFIDLYKAGRDHWLRDSYWALTGRPLPVFREGLIEPVWAEYGSDIYKAYNEVPAFDDVFQYFPYNTVAGNNLPDDCYAAGRLLLARLYRYYVHHPNHAFYGLLYKKLVCAALDAAKKAHGQYLNEKKGIIVGVEGEMLVRSELNKFDDLAIHLYNIRFEFEGNSIENDCITITPYGVFSIEVKNFGSEGQYDLQIAEDGQWRKISAERKIDEQLPNTFIQVMNHVNGTRRMLKARLQEKTESSLNNKEILVKPIVIISNEQVQIDNASGQVILRPSGVYNYIFNSSGGNACYTREEMKEIEQILLQSKLPDNKYPIIDYHKMIEKIQEVFEIDNELPRRIYRLENEIKNLFDESSEKIVPASKYDDAFAEMFFAMFYRPEHSDSKLDDENR
jgi:hypothetical protein